jgi:hypothetical protein
VTLGIKLLSPKSSSCLRPSSMEDPNPSQTSAGIRLGKSSTQRSDPNPKRTAASDTTQS